MLRHWLSYCQGRAVQSWDQGQVWELNSSCSWKVMFNPQTWEGKNIMTKRPKREKSKAVQGWASVLFPWSVCSITQRWRIKSYSGGWVYWIEIRIKFILRYQTWFVTTQGNVFELHEGWCLMFFNKVEDRLQTFAFSPSSGWKLFRLTFWITCLFWSYNKIM